MHTPVVYDSGRCRCVYNDFYVEDGADVTITLRLRDPWRGVQRDKTRWNPCISCGKECQCKICGKPLCAGNGSGKKVLNPVTKIYVGENSVFTLETTQIEGVDFTEHETHVELSEGAKLYVTEKLMTHKDQKAISNMDVELNGENSSARIVSRSVAKGASSQVFHPKAIGNQLCHAHVQCDSIIMGSQCKDQLDSRDHSNACRCTDCT